MNRDKFLDGIESKIGYPYRWGANGPGAFDCSGLVVWGLRQAGGTVPDLTAQGLLDYYHRDKCLFDLAEPGALYFYSSKGDPNKIDHVMIVLRKWACGKRILVGARGGDGTTVNEDVAWSRKAMVDVVQDSYWRSALMFAVDPFRDEM